MDEKKLTLSELLGRVKGVISDVFPLGVWVTAEIGEMKVNPYSGHCYMELVEKGTSDGAPKAKAAATVWRSRWAAVESYFCSVVGESPAAGMQVLLKVAVTFHETYGFSLSVIDIDPSFTLGGAEQRRRETITKLKADGILDLNASLEPEQVVQRIAVISSAAAAGLRDFVQHIDAAPYRFDVELFEAVMQGAEAEDSIISALEKVADRMDDFDAVVMIRGGGSRSDLGCFDSYALCSNIAQFPLPVLTGIGHDKDVSVADIVANRALKTPTAVADFLIERIESFDNSIGDLYGRIVELSEETMERNRLRLQQFVMGLSHAATATLHSAEMRTERSASIVRIGVERTMERQIQTVERLGVLLRIGVDGLLTDSAAALDAAALTVAGNDPERILSLGFAIVRRDGKAQKEAAALHAGQEVDIQLAKGEIKAKIS